MGIQSAEFIRCPLTPRQLNVVEQLATGAPAKLVAAHLRLTINMVNNDIQHALERTRAGNAVGLVAKALREGWIR